MSSGRIRIAFAGSAAYRLAALSATPLVTLTPLAASLRKASKLPVTVKSLAWSFGNTNLVGPTTTATTGQLPSFTLTSPNSGTQEFTHGLSLKRNALGPSQNVAVSGANATVTKLTFHPNGNTDHILVSGTYTSVANVASTVSLSVGTPAAGANLTSADITAAAPTATVQVAGVGTLTLASLLATPERTWISNRSMVECKYLALFGGYEFSFYVRKYLGGKSHVIVAAARQYLDDNAGHIDLRTSITANVIITIGGVTLYNGTHEHPPNSRGLKVEAWIGGDPQVIPTPDFQYLIDTYVVPNIPQRGIDASRFASLYQAHVPYQRGNIPDHMGSGGFHEHLNIVPDWTSTWIATRGDARAYRSILANADAANSFLMDFRHNQTKDYIRPTAANNWSIYGSGENGDYSTQWGEVTGVWEFNHCAELSTIAYMLTGHRWYYETMLSQTSLRWLCKSAGNGLGTQRVINGEERGTAWSLLDLTQTAKFARADDPVGQEYKELARWNFEYQDWLRVNYPQPYTPLLGLGYIYPSYTFSNSSIGQYQQEYFSMVCCYASLLKPFTDMTNVNNLRDSTSQICVLTSGQSGVSTEYSFEYGANFTLVVAAFDGGPFATNGGEIFQYHQGRPNNVVGNTLTGISAGIPSEAYQGYWGYHLSALAWAVDAGVSGAAAGWARTIAADNYSVTQPGFAYNPGWSAVPRTTVITSPLDPEWYGTLSGLGDNVWMEIPGSAMAGHNPAPGFEQQGQAQNRVDGWNSLTLNRATGKLRNPGNGGHGDWQGNEVMEVDLFATGVSTWPWVFLRQPTIQANAPLYAAPHNLEGRKPSAHSYWSIFDTQDGYITVLGTNAVWGSGNEGSEHALYKFDLAANDWVGGGTYPNNAYAGIDLDVYDRGGMAIDPVTKSIYYCSAIYGSFKRFDPWNNSITWLAGEPHGGYFNFYVPASVDHNRGQLVWFGNNYITGAAGVLYNITTNVTTAITFTGPAIDIFNRSYFGGLSEGGTGYGVHYDPALGNGQGRHIMKTKKPGELILIRPMGAGPAGEDWYTERLTTTGGSSQPDLDTRHIVCNRFLPLDMHDGRTVYVYIPDEASNVWVIRPSRTS